MRNPSTRGLVSGLWAAALLLLAACGGAPLPETQDERPALGVVLAAGGYPGSYRKGDVIEGLPPVDDKDCKVFHAGTGERDGQVVTSGGRVLCTCALGSTIAKAQARAYECAGRIHWRDVYYRTDIGYRALDRTT